MNKLKCGDCANYDPQTKIEAGKVITKSFGRCAKQTLYPTAERDGQVFPQGVERAEEGTLPRPDQIKIVNAKSIITECLFAIRKP